MQRITAGGIVMAAGVGVCLAMMGPVLLQSQVSIGLPLESESFNTGVELLNVAEPHINTQPQSSVKNGGEHVNGAELMGLDDEPGMITRVVSLEGVVDVQAGAEGDESAAGLAGAALSAMIIADENVKPEVRLMDGQALLVLRGTKPQTEAGLEVIAQKRVQVNARQEQVAQEAIAAAQQRAKTAEETARILDEQALALQAELTQQRANTDQALAQLESERARAVYNEQQLLNLQQQTQQITGDAQRAVNVANERAAYAEARLRDIAAQPPVVVVPSPDDESLRRRNWYLESQLHDLEHEVGILRGRLRDVRPLNSFAGNLPPVGPLPRGNSGHDGHDGHDGRDRRDGRGGNDRRDDRNGGRGNGQGAPRDVTVIPGGPLPLPAPPRLEGPALALNGGGYQRKENLVSQADRAKQAAERESREREESAARQAREQQEKAQRTQADVARQEREAKEKAQREQDSRERSQREQAERERKEREKQERDRIAKEKQERERQERAQAEAQKRQKAEEKRMQEERKREEDRKREADRKNSGDPQPVKPRKDDKPQNSFGGNPPK